VKRATTAARKASLEGDRFEVTLAAPDPSGNTVVYIDAFDTKKKHVHLFYEHGRAKKVKHGESFTGRFLLDSDVKSVKPAKHLHRLALMVDRRALGSAQATVGTIGGTTQTLEHGRYRFHLVEERSVTVTATHTLPATAQFSKLEWIVRTKDPANPNAQWVDDPNLSTYYTPPADTDTTCVLTIPKVTRPTWIVARFAPCL